MTLSPWQMLGEMPDIELVWTTDDDLLRGDDAWWDPDSRQIFMDLRLKQVVKRCALAHELAHVVREDASCGIAVHDDRMEIAADRLASRWLLPDLNAIAHAFVTAESNGHAAEMLWVTLPILEARYAAMHPAERHYIRRKVAEVRHA